MLTPRVRVPPPKTSYPTVIALNLKRFGHSFEVVIPPALGEVIHKMSSPMLDTRQEIPSVNSSISE